MWSEGLLLVTKIMSVSIVNTNVNIVEKLTHEAITGSGRLGRTIRFWNFVHDAKISHWNALINVVRGRSNAKRWRLILKFVPYNHLTVPTKKLAAFARYLTKTWRNT